VLMGINRIVVTEGEIKASVLFDVTAHDKVDNTTEHDRDRTDTSNYQEKTQQGGGWFSDPDRTTQTVNTSVSTQHTHLENKSSEEIKAHANLSGSVLVRFKSETFPLEGLASSADVANTPEKSKR